MHIVIGTDHAGFEIKEKLLDFLSDQGMTITDVGTDSPESCDYPDFAVAVAQEVVQRQAEGENVRGILLCGSGIGMSIAANKVQGARAALVTEKYMATQAVEHDGANILVLAARINSPREIRKFTELFLRAELNTQEPKYARRLHKIAAYEDSVYKDQPHYSA